MTPDTQTVKRRPTRKAKAKAPTRLPWWGDGLAPHRQWPGVTIEIPAVWSAKNARWQSPDGRYYFDQEAADKAVSFFPTLLVHHIGEFAGQPFELLDYQKKLLTRPLLGWKSAATGYRRFRKLFAFLPKGAGKSPWGAGTGLYLLLCDNEPAAEIYAVAADKEQARTVHTNAKIMVEESPDLLEECEVLRDAIYHPASRSTYKVLSSDAKTKHSFRPHVVIFDEIHAQPNRDLYEALSKSMVKRRQPLMLIITHAGDDDEGICYEEYEYAKGVLSGANPDERCLPVIFEAKPEEDWTSPKVWKRVNPGHGITVQHEGIAAACQEALVEPRKRNDFLRFTLNRWVNQAVAWIPIDWWDACPSSLPGDDELRKLTVCGGLDLAQKIDLAAFVAVFKEPLNDLQTIQVDAETEAGKIEKKNISLNYRIHVLPMFWIPEDTMNERIKKDKIRYDTWAPQWVTITEGSTIDYNRIYKDIVAMAERFPLLKQAEIGYDPAFATDIAGKLSEKGFKVIEIPQNYTHMNEPCQILEALLKAKRVTSDGNRCMRWNIENVAVKKDDAGRIRPVKPKRSAKKIDGVVATLMGLARLVLQPEATVSVYSTPGYQPMVF
jgi:phage terminase large subunit-like protein